MTVESDMRKESEYIIILCGEFNDKYIPLTRSAFWEIYHKYGDSIEALVNSDEEKITELLKRSASVSFKIEELARQGFHITTFLDDDFPKKLLEKLNKDGKDFCPPLLYTCGNSALNRKRMVGYVGSRTVNEDDILWTEKRVDKNIRDGYGIVTGGAKGIDSTALIYAIEHGGNAVVFLPDNIKEKVREPFYQKNILNGKLVLYSQVSPLAAKSRNSFVAAAMERNKFIYAQSVGTVVVHTDLEKGGTWAGAKEALNPKHRWSIVYTWDHKGYPGNQKLISMGAAGLSDDGALIKPEEKQQSVNIGQMSLFDMMPTAM
jgi:predicted Rossmann fold nucleotide-binding protein DprA/Smf involved in DNA uptake